MEKQEIKEIAELDCVASFDLAVEIDLEDVETSYSYGESRLAVLR